VAQSLLEVIDGFAAHFQEREVGDPEGFKGLLGIFDESPLFVIPYLPRILLPKACHSIHS
jgi:hypothetical protein